MHAAIHWSRRIAAERDPDTLLPLAVAAIRDLTGAAGGAVVLAAGRPGDVPRSLADGMPVPEPDEGGRPRVPARWWDAEAELFVERDVRPTELGLPDGPPLGAVLAATVVVAGRRVGWLLATGARDAFEAVRDEVVLLVSAQLGVALEAAHAAATEERYRALVEQLPGIVYNRNLDAPLQPSYVSPQVEQLFGYSQEEVLRDPDFLLRVVHPEDRERLHASSGRARPGEDDGPQSIEYRVVARDGSVRWVRNHAQALRDGSTRYVLGVILDVSREHAARQEAEDLFDLSPEPIGVVGADGRWRRANAALEELLGRSLEELQRTDYLDVLHPEDVELATRAFEGLFQGERVVDVECRVRRGEGDWRLVSWRAKALPGGAEAIVTARDMTRQRQLEEHIQVAQRLEALGRLAGGVAHDFNNLLTVITTYASFVSSELPPEHSAAADVQVVLDAAARASRLTSQLLAVGQRQVQRLEPTDLTRVVQGLQEMLERVSGARVQVELDLSDDLWPVRADRGQVDQILLNLAVNARDAMPRGGTLRIGTSNVVVGPDEVAHYEGEPQAGPHVALVVEDTGDGMDGETRRRIFDPFFSTKGMTGTGLGLATVYGIVCQHGGGVRVESEPGQGSRFELILPRGRSGQPADGASEGAAPLRGAGTVLVVEDDASLRPAVCRTLRRHGYRVLEAPSGQEALETLDGACHGRVDLILTDVVMPSMTGPEMVREVRGRWPEARVLYMSGYPDDSVLESDIRYREVDLLQKPFSPVELLRAVERSLR